MNDLTDAHAYAQCILEETNVKLLEVQISRKLWVIYDGEFSLRLEGRNLGEPQFAARAFLKQIQHLSQT